MKPTDLHPNPNGCRHCGIDRETHLQRWTSTVQWHLWTEPSDEQRKLRLLARRNHPTNS